MSKYIVIDHVTGDFHIVTNKEDLIIETSAICNNHEIETNKEARDLISVFKGVELKVAPQIETLYKIKANILEDLGEKYGEAEADTSYQTSFL